MKKTRKLGFAFPDQMLKVTGPPGHFRGKGNFEEWEDILLPEYKKKADEDLLSPWRTLIFGLIFLFTFFGIFLRLFHLQVISGKEARVRADENRVALKVVHAPRGVIYDREGRVLAESNPGFRLGEKIITRDEALNLESRNDPTFEQIEIDAIRFYPQGESVAHIVGYVGEIQESELKNSKVYKNGDRIGRAGIEQTYEDVLRGKDGAEIIEIDASGKKIGTIRRVEPVPGQNVILSIDAFLQKQVFETLKKGTEKASSCCSAAAAIDPKNSQVLALASYPSYNNNDFTDPEKNDNTTAYLADSNSPLLNRAIAGQYPPGSTFKIVTALAGLTSGKINKDTEVEDTGVMSLGQWSFPNWYFLQYGRKEGMVNLVKALQRSNDIYFYKVGQMLGEKLLGEEALKFGFGKKSGIDLPGEAEGLIPDSAWKEKNIGDVWYPGDTLHMAIGQGFILATPLQVLAETALVANGGKKLSPHLAVKITNPDGSVSKEFNFKTDEKIFARRDDLDLVRTGLIAVPKEGGTAWPFFNFSIPTAGKTGTAEYGDPKDRTHAWYTSFAPVDDPKIVLTVLVEGGGEGSNVAAPIAKDIYTWYFNPDKNNLKNLDNGIASDSAKMLGE